MLPISDNVLHCDIVAPSHLVAISLDCLWLISNSASGIELEFAPYIYEFLLVTRRMPISGNVFIPEVAPLLFSLLKGFRLVFQKSLE